jgi:uncharacterized protein (DUF3084 family)
MCKYLTDCRRLNQHNDCEFKHSADENSVKNLAEVNKYQAEVENLKGDILKLKEDIKKKTLKLDKLYTENTQIQQIVNNKDSEIFKLKVTFEKSLNARNDEIANLKKEIEKMAEELKKEKLAKVTPNPVICKPKERSKETSNQTKVVVTSKLKCPKCKHVSNSKVMLQMHMEFQHSTYNFDQKNKLSNSDRV